MTRDERLQLLRDHNRQRHKSAREESREELIDINPDEAEKDLLAYEYESASPADPGGLEIVQAPDTKGRYEISEDKAEHLRHIKKLVLEDLKEYWGELSSRMVHYHLLNFGEFVRGHCWPHKDKPGYGTKQTLLYQNDKGSANATDDLIVRMRFKKIIPWKAFEDKTRPCKIFWPFKNIREFIRGKVQWLFDGYFRSLMQSQPDHVEVFVEKNTVYGMSLRITSKYQITTSSGRGFNGVGPWKLMADRFKKSGKRRLVLITLSDYDPEGLRIPIAALQTLRDELEIDADRLLVVRAGVTRRQVKKYRLATTADAKPSSANKEWFLEQTRGDRRTWELEALKPADLMAELEETIKRAINLDLYNAEVDRQGEEGTELEDLQEQAMERLRDIVE
jgi:hypothetical protein